MHNTAYKKECCVEILIWNQTLEKVKKKATKILPKISHLNYVYLVYLVRLHKDNVFFH